MDYDLFVVVNSLGEAELSSFRGFVYRIRRRRNKYASGKYKMYIKLLESLSER